MDISGRSVDLIIFREFKLLSQNLPIRYTFDLSLQQFTPSIKVWRIAFFSLVWLLDCQGNKSKYIGSLLFLNILGTEFCPYFDIPCVLLNLKVQQFCLSHLMILGSYFGKIILCNINFEYIVNASQTLPKIISFFFFF